MYLFIYLFVHLSASKLNEGRDFVYLFFIVVFTISNGVSGTKQVLNILLLDYKVN